MAQTCHLGCALLQFGIHAGILGLQVLIQAVQRVNLHHIVAQHGSHRGQFLLQTGNLTGIRGFHLLQLLQQLLRLHLLLRQLCDDRVVVDLRLHLTVLQGETLVFVLHLLLVEGCQFLHILIHLLLLLQAEVEPCKSAQQGQDDDNKRNNDFLIHKPNQIKKTVQR